MKRFSLALVLLAAALAASGCGRKNLPVAPTGVAATPVGESKTPNENAPANTENFQRAHAQAHEVNDDDDLTLSPAQVTRNRNAPKKSFPLDFLLN